MSREGLDERTKALLGIVSEGSGTYDARWIDITFSSRHGAGERTVMAELQSLRALGLVSQRVDEGGVGGRWMITPAGAALLAAA